jgi:hypothetical protein
MQPAWGTDKATKTGRSGRTAAERETMDRLSAKAARLSTAQLATLAGKYRALGRLDIVDAIYTELIGR